jgi:hypothetical protein
MSHDHTGRSGQHLLSSLEDVAQTANHITAALRSADLDEAAAWLNHRQAALTDFAAAVAAAAPRGARGLPPALARAARNALRADAECLEVARAARDDVIRRLIESHSGLKVTRAYRAPPPSSARAISERK